MPVAYLGSKRRYAPAILDALEARFGPAKGWPGFVDLCCGTASVALEAAARMRSSAPIVLVDAGPWGAFWAAFAADPAGVIAALRAIWKEGEGTGKHCRLLNGAKVARDPQRWAAEFLLVLYGTTHGRLPQSSVGSWRTTCTHAASDRGRGPDALVARLEAAAVFAPRLRAIHGRAEDVAHRPRELRGPVYIDPGYPGMTAGHYQHTCDIPAVVAALQAHGIDQIAVSNDKARADLPGVDLSMIAGKRCLDRVCRREVLLFP